MESDPENNSYFQQGTMRIKMESESECTSAVNDSDHVKTHDSSRTASNYPMADKPDEPMDLTDLPLPSRSNGPVKTQDAAASTSGTPFAKTQIAIPSEIRKKKKKRIAAPKSSAQRQREYRQRIAASRTPAQATATRISDTERKRNYRLRKAANLTLTSGSLESTTASSSHSPGKSNDVQNSTQRQLTNQQRQSLATEPAQTTVQPSTSSDQIKVPAASTSAKPFPQPPPIAARKSSARRQNDRRNIETYKMTSTDTYQLKWHSHSSHLNGSVAALLRSERFTDVVLCTMDGSQIPAHKFILSSCSVYLSNLFEGQRSVTRMGGMLYVVLPSEISTKALKILVEYMYKGETTVSNEVLDTVLKAGEVLKIRGLWRQTDEAGGDSTPAEKTTAPATAVVNKQILPKKPEDSPAPKILVKKDDKLLKAFNPVQQQGGVNRPMFIGPPKLVFIKTTEGGTQAALRPGAPKGQTILVAPAPQSEATCTATVASPSPSNTLSVSTSIVGEESPDEAPPPRMLRRHAAERKYGKRQKTEITVEAEEAKDCDNSSETSKKSSTSNIEIQSDIQVKDEPDWDASSIEEEERSIAEMFQAEMSVKSEPIDEVDIDEDSLVYSPLACELCAEVFTLPAAWVRHVQAHAAGPDHTHARKRKCRSASDDTEETTALLRCDLCQKHFPNPAEWVRHIQSTHTETEGAQNKNCPQCKKSFPSHASMLIHMRTHTGERPFVCGLCNKGFNVKSNLLRHLRTLHDQVISPQVEDEPDEVTPGPSEIKRES